VGEVKAIVTSGEWRITIAPPAALMPYIIPKGSIAVAGVSLTLASVDPEARTFDIALIPTTLAKTTLGQLRIGSRLNLECDAMAKTMVHWLNHYASSGALKQALAGNS
jgi:riboflavin synthase alpha subunit